MKYEKGSGREAGSRLAAFTRKGCNKDNPVAQEVGRKLTALEEWARKPGNEGANAPEEFWPVMAFINVLQIPNRGVVEALEKFETMNELTDSVKPAE